MVDPLLNLPAPFIVGVGRSGTTLLRLMLDAHPELAIPSETHFLTNLLTQDSSTLEKGDVFRIMTEAATWPNLAVDAISFEKALDKLQCFSVGNAIRTFYTLYATRLGKERWGDKSPPYRSCMRDIQRVLPEAHFIHIVRDGRDVALSYRGLWFGPGDNIEVQAQFWVDQIISARRQATDLKHYFEVKYEELVQSPEVTLRNICNYIRLSFDRRMLDYHKFASQRLSEHVRSFGPTSDTPRELDKFMVIYENTKLPLQASRIGRWQKEMSEAERRRYEAIAGSLLRDLRYEI